MRPETLVGLLLMVGAIVGATALRFSEKYPRLSFGLWMVGAVLFTVGIFGAQDTFCGNGACS